MSYLGAGIVLLLIGLLLQAFTAGALATIGWIAAVIGVVLIIIGVVLWVGGRRGSRL